jgi:hypothetical protein
MDCEGGDASADAAVCCISPKLQDPSRIRCYANSDCCHGTCNVTTGQCYP